MLPELRELLQAIRDAHGNLVVDITQALPVLRAAKQNGGGHEATPLLNDLQTLNTRLRRFQELGIQLKDVERGLVDFPAWREDREVFLCWHLGEDEVRYWHDLDSGFAGREPL